MKIEFEGHVATLNVKPLTALILAGFLKPSMEGVNIVSAPAKANVASEPSGPDRPRYG